MRRCSFIFAAILVALFHPNPAHAQDPIPATAARQSPLASQSTDIPLPRFGLARTRWALQAGAFFPVGPLADQLSRHGGFSVNFGYDLQPFRLSRLVSFAVYAETAMAGRPLNVAEGRFYRDTTEDNVIMTGVGLAARATGRTGKKGQVYAEGGVGLYRIDRTLSITRKDISGLDLFNEQQNGDEVHQTLQSRFLYRSGLHIAAGVLLSHGYYSEVRFLDAGTWQGVPYHGIAMNIGTRF